MLLTNVNCQITKFYFDDFIWDEKDFKMVKFSFFKKVYFSDVQLQQLQIDNDDAFQILSSLAETTKHF